MVSVAQFTLVILYMYLWSIEHGIIHVALVSSQEIRCEHQMSNFKIRVGHVYTGEIDSTES